jgi:AAA family ATP:ADP antiporter
MSAESGGHAHSHRSGFGRLLGRLANVRPEETRTVVLAFVLFFCVLGGYFAVRPVRETVGTVLGRERVADLYGYTWAASLAIIPIYGAIVARVRRSAFLPWVYGFVAIFFAIVGVVFLEGEDHPTVGWVFYVVISVLNLFIVSVFWSFLLELFASEQTKRLFGVIAAGGTTGALFGPFVTDLMVERVGNSGILFLGAAMFAIAIVCQQALLALWARTGSAGGAQAPTDAVERPAARPQDRAIGGNPFAGITLIVKSPYLLAIAMLVVFGATINTFLYFEQLDLVKDAFEDTEQRTRFFARLDWIVQGLAVVSQLFITGRIASRLGLVVLLTIVPVAMMGGFAALAAGATLGVFAIVMIARRAGEYAFVRLGREMMFSRLDNETKYKAKNVIDVPIYRGADFAAAQVENVLRKGGLTSEGIAVIGIGLAALWALNGFWLGRRHDRGN